MGYCKVTLEAAGSAVTETDTHMSQIVCACMIAVAVDKLYSSATGKVDISAKLNGCNNYHVLTVAR